MRDEIKPPTARALRTLKAFQRDTVDHVYKRMYETHPPARRFLIADEVGLGKTLVAKGIIARLIDDLWEKPVGRIDIVYICSNTAIARQNISKLNITGHTDHRLPDRITLLPRDVNHLRGGNLRFISFTPGTSFNQRAGLGLAEERALLFWLLPDDWICHREGAISVLSGTARRRGFNSRVDDFRQWYEIDEKLRADFRAALEALGGAPTSANLAPSLKERFLALCRQVGSRENLDQDEGSERSAIVGELRERLARVCINELEPDLIILDEFQRFRDLLHGGPDDLSATLARALFEYESGDKSSQARVLLLSATPYKMYTMNDEAGRDDHYAEFLETVRFLQHDETKTKQFEVDLEEYRKQIFHYVAGGDQIVLQAVKQRVETALRDVMVRTERLAVTADRNGMLVEVPSAAVTLGRSDLAQYLALQRVAEVVEQPDTMEFWKSAPYALNFMDEYQLKERFRSVAQSPDSSRLFDALSSTPGALLTHGDLASYRRLDPANARLRSLLHDTIDSGVAELFWIAPSCPYYKMEGPFDGASKFTKRLVFSAWQVVPKVVASLVSLEAERRLFGVPEAGEAGKNTEAERRKRTGRRRLRYTVDGSRLGGMPVLALMYPSPSLAALGDPLQITSELSTETLPSLGDVIDRVRGKIAAALSQILPASPKRDSAPERWYWAAPILLDLVHDDASTREWFGQARLAEVWQGDGAPRNMPDVAEATDTTTTDDRWAVHVEEARRVVEGTLDPPLGAPPEELATVLAWLAVGGPANNVLRALGRVCGGADSMKCLPVRNGAGQIAEGFRSLFNQPEVVSSITGRDTDEQSEVEGRNSYWRRTLEYASRGCLSSVLDEYAHVTFEAASLPGKPIADIADTLARRLTTALTLQTATLRADMPMLDANARAVHLDKAFGFRTAIAVRYGTRGEEGQAADRNERLQIAFNSPFWPFVLCTTSVGQEGLDFHQYCHAVVHWNLPSNPVDLEQREGRVHRYKGHAVRKNVAARHGSAALSTLEDPDPWVTMFRKARQEPSGDDSDVVPYWVYTVEGGAQIERHVPALPLSRDVARKYALAKSLAVYRMAFGQSRQEDLVAFLERTLGPEERKRAGSELMVKLGPDRSPARAYSGTDDAELASRELSAAVKQGRAIISTPTNILSLQRLRMLLNAFSAVRQKTQPPTHLETRAERSASDVLVSIRVLLDAFTAMRIWPSSVRNHQVSHDDSGGCAPSRQQLEDLLAQFSRMRPVPSIADNPLPRYRELLDRHALLR